MVQARDREGSERSGRAGEPGVPERDTGTGASVPRMPLGGGAHPGAGSCGGSPSIQRSPLAEAAQNRIPNPVA